MVAVGEFLIVDILRLCVSQEFSCPTALDFLVVVYNI